MKIYCAPMEGVTGYVYRNVHHQFYGGIDRYYAPFITPKPKRGLSRKELKDILPEHNEGFELVPQVLTNKVDGLIHVAEILMDHGYEEVNFNIGCPSGTVVSKGRGSGFLKYPEELDRFFDDYFHRCEMPLSVKTRLGVTDSEEFGALMDIFNRYPIKELIVHARVREDYYKKPVSFEAFVKGYDKSRLPVCYNGDVCTASDLERIVKRLPDLPAVMIGRGLIANPQLGEILSDGEKETDFKRLRSFHDTLCDAYKEYMSGEKNVLCKMKEAWCFMGGLISDDPKIDKKIKKSKTLQEYYDIINTVF